MHLKVDGINQLLADTVAAETSSRTSDPWRGGGDLCKLTVYLWFLISSEHKTPGKQRINTSTINTHDSCVLVLLLECPVLHSNPSFTACDELLWALCGCYCVRKGVHSLSAAIVTKWIKHMQSMHHTVLVVSMPSTLNSMVSFGLGWLRSRLMFLFIALLMGFLPKCLSSPSIF